MYLFLIRRWWHRRAECNCAGHSDQWESRLCEKAAHRSSRAEVCWSWFWQADGIGKTCSRHWLEEAWGIRAIWLAEWSVLRSTLSQFRHIPQDIYPDVEIHLFHEGVHIDDVKQGKFGDCYFLAVLAGLARQTDIMQQVKTYKHRRILDYINILRLDFNPLIFLDNPRRRL